MHIIIVTIYNPNKIGLSGFDHLSAKLHESFEYNNHSKYNIFEATVFTVGQPGQDIHSACIISKLILHVSAVFLSPLTTDAFHKTLYYSWLTELLSLISLLLSLWLSLLILLELPQKLF